ncbi:hypothetical protein K505DRAFT_256911 [Melanomma pulvis-pyrius CBS 109.77]|jgi:activating signal cointegrator complex subunit 1|uniref:A-kinase anchor protein 7-like phosphoesterase domain-containing protein n=1 Tax=Melanomma pulvis-pyrius CBS 109.77 TaxID=1314802 RepID=A0A6A6WUM4_9PLEO|nr:hypothetical protein K505DRAFT_256911 [Melanomma pulvis-pyrius CBS 109.77]
MGKKKAKGEYNDFIDGEKLRDNTEVRTSLQNTTPTADISHHPIRHHGNAKGRATGRKPNKPQLTHFLCLPLVNAGSRTQLEESLAGFKEELEREGVVPLKAVRPVGTLHLTLGVMALDAEGLVGVERCLNELDFGGLLGDLTSAPAEGESKSRQDFEPISIDLKGLVPMQPDQKISILYAEPIDATSRLYSFASALRGHFVDRGFLVEDSRPLKLHATIINTIYVKVKGHPPLRRAPQPSKRDSPADTHGGEDSTWSPENEQAVPSIASSETPDRSKGHGPNAKSLLKFDARELIAQYNDFVWAENVSIERVQICKMGAKKILNGDGDVVAEEYEEVHGRRIL